MNVITAVGTWMVLFFRELGRLVTLLRQVIRASPSMYGREFLRNMHQLGYESTVIALIVATVAGATVVLQTSLYVQRFGARTQLGWAAGYAIVWEFGPLFLGLIMAARVGARNAAELANLAVGGQIEGLRGISLEPLAILVAPRVWAIILSMFLLAGTTFLVAILVEAVAAFLALKIPLRVFMGNLESSLSSGDYLGGLLKTTCFGLAIALISTRVGLATTGGARGVGQSAARSVFYSSGVIFALDLMLTPLLARWLA